MSPVAAVAHTDIQGSTRLWERLGPGFAPLLSEHNRILREAAKAGRELATEGDSFTFGFSSAQEAVTFALTAQLELHAHAWPVAAGELLVRIGVHAGEATGDASSVAPRARLVAGAAHGGQILLTAQARDAAGSALEGAVLTDLGEQRLAAHDRPERVFQVLPAELRSREFPPPRTLSSRPTNIAPEPDRFVGRVREFEELSTLVPSPAGRLVTLTGPGGIGKSRLARELSLSLLSKFEGGCWLADLLEARTAADVSRAVAHALGIPLPAGENPAGAIAGALEFRKPLLLVLDGFEALVDHAAATIGVWAKRARNVRFLVTSITLLGLSGEREVALGPLSSPGVARSPSVAGELASFDAALLFLDRAARARPGFALTDANANAIGRICADLEGIPLAIELAAARLADLPAEEMLRELESQFHLRDSSPTGGPRRRQSLAGALEWSYGLLSDWQRSAFHQVCAFRGGFFLESAEEVIDLSAEQDAPLAIDAVQALRDRSLLRTHDTPFGTRFSMFRAIRDFGERHFKESSGEPAWRALEDRHARHFLAQVRRWSAAGPAAAELFDRLDLELDNFFAIHDRFLSRAAAGDPGAAATAARAILALEPLLVWRGPFDQRLARLQASRAVQTGDPVIEADLEIALADALISGGRAKEGALAADRAASAASRSGQQKSAARAALAVAKAQLTGGDLDRGAAQAAAARDLYNSIGDKLGITYALDVAALVAKSRGRLDQSRQLLEEALRLARELGDDAAVARCAANLGATRHVLGDAAGAFACFDEAEKRLGAVGSRLNVAKLAGMRGQTYMDQGDWERAEPLIEEALAVHREAGMKQPVFLHLTALARVRRGQLRIEDCGALYAEALKLAREIGDGSLIVLAMGNIGTVMHDQGRMNEALETFQATATEAQRLGLRGSYAVNTGNAGMSLMDLGRLDEARTSLREAADSFRAQGAIRTLRAFNVLKALCNTETKAGQAEAAKQAAREANETAQALGLESGKDAGVAASAREIRKIAESS